MTVDPGVSQTDDSRLIRAAREYLTELEAGRTPDRQLWLTQYPGINAEELAECLDGMDLAFALGAVVRREEPAHPTQPLGDFRIVREIGRGGMGVVYEAIQLSLGRKVALKVLPFAAALDARQLQRFQLEAQAAAQLHHTHIVPIYFVGCERGTHFYAMQLIDGSPVSEALKELQPAGTGRGSSSSRSSVANRPPGSAARSTTIRSTTSGGGRDRFRTVAQLIAQVADALDYAHQSGVIHRDIKPANLLLDNSGKVWVTDFGLAQVAASTLVTQTGDLLGTLRYMSPEQASGQRTLVDHRTDIYSLGVTLYELLTLQPMFPGQDRQRLLHQILNEEPRGVRNIDRSIPVELETIVLKATASSPVDRYATATEMGNDLRRFLEQRPILARRPTVLDRTRKWLRRHPSFVVSVFVVLALGLVGLSLAIALISKEKSLTKGALERERVRAAEAQWRFEMAQRAADDMILLAEEELADDPLEEGLRQRLLESALSYYQEFLDAKQDDPTIQAELIETRDRVRRILADLTVLQADRDSMLLREPDVLDDLQLSDSQREVVAKVVARHGQHRDNFKRLPGSAPSPPKLEEILEIAHDNNRELTVALTEDQRKRLRQIALQWMGPRALSEADVMKALDLSKEQKRAIRALGAGGMFGRMNRPPRGMAQPQYRIEDLLAVLTPDQRAQWEALIGPPFTGQMSQGQRPFPPLP